MHASSEDKISSRNKCMLPYGIKVIWHANTFSRRMNRDVFSDEKMILYADTFSRSKNRDVLSVSTGKPRKFLEV